MYPNATDFVQYISELDVVGALMIATILGAGLGLERSLSGKQAGMRTYALVSLGSCLFAVVGTLASFELSDFASVNPLQIAGSVVLGIGFIGAGLSAWRSEGGHAELTTATGIWLAAAIGLACGFGFYTIAFVSTVLGLVIFSFFLKIENAMRKRWGKDSD